MKNRTSLKYLLLAALAVASLHGERARAEQNEGFLFQTFRDYVYDVDAQLEKATKIKAVSCVFEGTGGRFESDEGIGYCLWKNFFAALKTNDSPGVIQAKIKLPLDAPNDPPTDVLISWRPATKNSSNFWSDQMDRNPVLREIRSFRRILQHYLDNKIVIVSREGIAWNKVVNLPANIPGAIHKIEADFTQGPDSDNHLLGQVDIFDDLDGKAVLSFNVHSNFAFGKKDHVKLKLSGGTPQ